jgi:FMN phosphatase YigB (HAD superfamily)
MVNLIRTTIDRHGGGWIGMHSVAARSLRVIRALGWKGFTQRIRASRQQNCPIVTSPEAISFPQASPLSQFKLSIGIMVHVFYADLLDEFANDMANVPVPFVLMVSVVDEQTRIAAQSRFKKIPNVQTLHVRVVPNRGRDIAPFLLTFREEILALDLVCHVHTKKSLYSGSEQGEWRRYLMDALLGSADRVSWILGMFQAMPRLGMVYPESFVSMPLWAHTWLSNASPARELGIRLGIGIDPDAYLDYPAGSMFWARIDALRPLYDLKLSLDVFPEERGQTDGTMQHVVERMLGLIVRHEDMVVGIIPADRAEELRSEGARNWGSYFAAPLGHKIGFGAVDAKIVSFDLFDTLVTRPFLYPSGARDYLAHLVEKKFGLTDFATLRLRAETIARTRHGRDVDCTIIYETMATMAEFRSQPVAEIRELELATEKRLLKPRTTVVESARKLAHSDKRIVAVSDMYMNADELRRVLPPSIAEILQGIHVSCENGWRKDTSEVWERLPKVENIPVKQWLHVGDNEHSDIQLPLAMGFIHPVHVLRASSLLSVVPVLRDLRPKPTLIGRWQDQLWLGLVANHFNELADSHPMAFEQRLVIEEPETLGYTVMGPLVLDYTTWLAQVALDSGASRILFLSREGYLLQRAFQRLQKASPDLTSIHTSYLLASRRGVNTPALRTIEDLAGVFSAPYTGSLENLLDARLGTRIAAAATKLLGKPLIATEVFLPQMSTRVIDWLRPAAAAILGIAAEERDLYMQYWKNQASETCTIVADIGYAGTIQTQLAKITGDTLGGAYFAAKQAMDQVQINHGWARARFFDERHGGSFESPVMKYHLMLEAILTSPDGQFSHFERGPDTPLPVHFSNAINADKWSLIERVQAGTQRFIDDVCNVTGAETANLIVDNIHVQQPLHCVGTGLWQLGSWADALRVEDRYTGRGEVITTNGHTA